MPQEFVQVARASELKPGNRKLVWVGDTRVMLANVAGTFFAVDDLCPHARSPLSAGWLQGDEIMCALHGARFNVKTGEVLSSPAEDDLTCFAVKIEGDNVFIGVPEPAP